MTPQRLGRYSAVTSMVLTCLAVAGCSSGPEVAATPTPGPSQEMVTDGRYCGALSTDLVHQVLGTEELRVVGDDISGAHETPNTVVNCSINVIGSDDALNLTVNLESSQPRIGADAPAPGCTRTKVPTNWGTAFSCWNQDTMTSQATPAPRVFIRLSQVTKPQNRAQALAAAPELLQDVYAAIEAMG